MQISKPICIFIQIKTRFYFVIYNILLQDHSCKTSVTVRLFAFRCVRRSVYLYVHVFVRLTYICVFVYTLVPWKHICIEENQILFLAPASRSSFNIKALYNKKGTIIAICVPFSIFYHQRMKFRICFNQFFCMFMALTLYSKQVLI